MYINLSQYTCKFTHSPHYRHHYNELPADLRARLHLELPVGFMAYFESRYPCLLMRCVEIACRFLSTEKAFAPFCRVIAPLFQQNRSPATATPMSDQSIKSTATEGQTLLPLSDVLNVTPTKSSLIAASFAVPSSLSSAPPPSVADLAQETHTFSFPGVIASTTVTTELPGDSHPTNNAEKDLLIQQQVQQTIALSEDVVVWQGSALSQSLGCRGWWRLNLSNPNDNWVDAGCNAAISVKPRTQHQHLVRASTDFKYRSRLCTHWELTGGSGCPMRKKGKCDFGES